MHEWQLRDQLSDMWRAYAIWPIRTHDIHNNKDGLLTLNRVFLSCAVKASVVAIRACRPTGEASAPASTEPHRDQTFQPREFRKAQY